MSEHEPLRQQTPCQPLLGKSWQVLYAGLVAAKFGTNQRTTLARPCRPPPMGSGSCQLFKEQMARNPFSLRGSQFNCRGEARPMNRLETRQFTKEALAQLMDLIRKRQVLRFKRRLTPIIAVANWPTYKSVNNNCSAVKPATKSPLRPTAAAIGSGSIGRSDEVLATALAQLLSPRQQNLWVDSGSGSLPRL
jgi:hypothetical protein